VGGPLAAGWVTATVIALTMHGFWWPGRQTVVVLPLAAVAVTWWASERLLAVGALVGALTWWWLVVDGLRGRLTFVYAFERTGAPLYRLVRPLLPDLHRAGTTDAMGLAAWTLVAGALVVAGWRSGRADQRADEDAAAGEGAHADHPVADLDGDGAVR
jgi:hypothetical protein